MRRWPTSVRFLNSFLPGAMALLCLSCSPKGSPREQGPPKLTTGDLVMVDSREPRRALGRQVRDLLAARNYAGLDSLADHLRTTGALSPKGTWMLRSFYLEGLSGGEDDWNPTDPESMVIAIDQWRHARPTSITAPVALAYALVDWAWKARGTGAAQTITMRGRKAMVERLERADQVLKEARSLPEVCPGWWVTAFRVALGQGWEFDRYWSAYEEAIARNPEFGTYPEMAAYHLLPRWYGEEGDWEAFAAQVADADSNRAAGDARYARIVWNLEPFFGNIFRESKASWPRTRSGFAELQRRHPESLEITSQFCRMTFLANDEGQCRTLFEQIGNRYEVSLWPSPEAFARASNEMLRRR